jgi:hypothetical protein
MSRPQCRRCDRAVFCRHDLSPHPLDLLVANTPPAAGPIFCVFSDRRGQGALPRYQERVRRLTRIVVPFRPHAPARTRSHQQAVVANSGHARRQALFPACSLFGAAVLTACCPLAAGGALGPHQWAFGRKAVPLRALLLDFCAASTACRLFQTRPTRDLILGRS